MPPTMADWERAWSSLTHQGWARMVAAVSNDGVRRLADARRGSWTPLPVEEGVVRQRGFGSYEPLQDADVAVHELASLLVQELTEAATPGTPVLPPFNEVTWTHYPAGLGHITAHRDPPAYTGIIAVTTLRGDARFVAHSDAGKTHEWMTGPGDIVLLTGRGWPTETSRCPLHAVDPPKAMDRMILTLRSNARGAGAAYL